MAELHGKDGSVDTGSAVGGIKSWSIDYVIDVSETTDFADAGVKTFIAGCSSWSGSFEGYKDGAPQALSGATVTLTLKESATSTQKYTGTALITGLHESVGVDGVETISYDFQGTGALTVPTT